MENKKHIIATLIINFILITIFSIIILIYYIIIDCSFDISVLGIGEYLSFYNTELCVEFIRKQFYSLACLSCGVVLLIILFNLLYFLIISKPDNTFSSNNKDLTFPAFLILFTINVIVVLLLYSIFMMNIKNYAVPVFTTNNRGVLYQDYRGFYSVFLYLFPVFILDVAMFDMINLRTNNAGIIRRSMILLSFLPLFLVLIFLHPEFLNILCSTTWFYGKTLYSNPLLADTDVDGLYDGQEITCRIEPGAEPDEVYVFVWLHSDPNGDDSDGDGIIDSIDARPLNNDVKRIGLNSRYTSVLFYYPTEGDFIPSYGGNQDWFNSADYNYISNNGCGLIAATDTILYLLRNNPDFRNDNELFNQYYLSEADEYGNLEFVAYERIVKYLEQHYFSVKSGGLGKTLLELGFNKFSLLHKWNLRAQWNGSFYQNKLINLNEIEQQLNNDIPVILFIDGKTDESINSYTEDVISNRMRNNAFDRVIRNHWVTVTGVIYDGDTSWLEISTWGKKRYIDFQDYINFVERYSGLFTEMNFRDINNFLRIHA